MTYNVKVELELLMAPKVQNQITKIIIWYVLNLFSGALIGGTTTLNYSGTQKYFAKTIFIRLALYGSHRHNFATPLPG